MRKLEAAACDWQVVALNLGLTERGQGRQTDLPESGWYSNTLHAHGAPLPTGQLLPAGHVTPVVEDCCGQYSPAGQALHTEEPGSGAKVEGAQGEHDSAPVLGLACPGRQERQAAAVDDPFWGLYVPALQRVHKLQPLTFENVPAAQGAQTDTPEVGLLVPGLQG